MHLNLLNHNLQQFEHLNDITIDRFDMFISTIWGDVFVRSVRKLERYFVTLTKNETHCALIRTNTV